MERMLTRPEVEQMLGVSTATIYKWLGERKLPEPIRLGPRAIRWRLSELMKWLDEQPRASESRERDY